MKKTNYLIKLMTLFLAIIGGCCIVLTSYIIWIYPKISSTEKQQNSIAAIPSTNAVSESIIVSEVDDFQDSVKTEENNSSMPQSDEIIIAEQTVEQSKREKNIKEASDLSMKEESLVYGTENQIPYEEGTSASEAYYGDNNEIEEQVTQPEDQIYVSQGNNFDTYNNPSQQITADTYVLNTESLKIHHPSCRTVPKIAPQNYATSSSSILELLSQGYTTCGICFKNSIY